MLHVIEHAVVVHRAVRYRLRDVIDVATVWTDSVERRRTPWVHGNGLSRRVVRCRRW